MSEEEKEWFEKRRIEKMGNFRTGYDLERMEERREEEAWFEKRGIEKDLQRATDIQEPSKACIIATVFLGEDHPLLPPMRKFRDLFIPRSVMDIYYSIGTFILRKLGNEV